MSSGASAATSSSATGTKPAAGKRTTQPNSVAAHTTREVLIKTTARVASAKAVAAARVNCEAAGSKASAVAQGLGNHASLLREVGSFLHGFRWYLVWMHAEEDFAAALTISLSESGLDIMGDASMGDLNDVDASDMDAAFAYVFSDDDDVELL